MIEPALEPPCRLVSEKYRVRGRYPAATYHKNLRFTPGRGAGCPTSTIDLDCMVDCASRPLIRRIRVAATCDRALVCVDYQSVDTP
jgi:hypothetical protein